MLLARKSFLWFQLPKKRLLPKKKGVDIVVVQNSDAGGHGKQSLNLGATTLIPATRSLVGKDFPILSAGGVVNGTGLASALALGADGVVMGTRFIATKECLARDAFKDRIVTATGTDATIVSRSFDELSGFTWPEGVVARGLRDSKTVQQFHDKVTKEGYKATPEERDWYKEGDYTIRGVWAGAAVGQVNSIEESASIVETTVKEARAIIQGL